MTDKRVLLDSDAVIGWLVEYDQHHPHAVRLFEYLVNAGMQPVVTNLVIAECATWLSARVSQVTAQLFLRETRHIEIVYVTEAIHTETVALLQHSQKHHTSFIDYSNVVTMRLLEIPVILAFDEVYRKPFGLTTLQDVAGL